jgi:hypothetical protein
MALRAIPQDSDHFVAQDLPRFCQGHFAPGDNFFTHAAEFY